MRPKRHELPSTAQVLRHLANVNPYLNGPHDGQFVKRSHYRDTTPQLPLGGRHMRVRGSAISHQTPLSRSGRYDQHIQS